MKFWLISRKSVKRATLLGLQKVLSWSLLEIQRFSFMEVLIGKSLKSLFIMDLHTFHSLLVKDTCILMRKTLHLDHSNIIFGISILSNWFENLIKIQKLKKKQRICSNGVLMETTLLNWLKIMFAFMIYLKYDYLKNIKVIKDLRSE